MEYRLQSFAPWLASILLDVAVKDDVVQDPAHVVFIMSKNSYNTKLTVILHFSTPGVFWLWPTVQSKRVLGLVKYTHWLADHNKVTQ